MIVLAEPWQQLPQNASSRDIRSSAECAAGMGCRVYSIPPDFERCGDAAGALAMLPEQPVPVPAVWVGFIPDPERYEAIYHEARRKGVVLPNDPGQHRLAMELDRSLPLLHGITPDSVVVSETDDWAAAASALGYPLFVKGTVQSRKARGLRACAANDEGELASVVRGLFDPPLRSRGRVVLRRFVRLRHERTAPGDFPMGREYRRSSGPSSRSATPSSPG